MRSLVPFFLLAVGCNKGESTASEIRSGAATESTTRPITNDTVEDDTARHEDTDCDSDFGSITGAVIYDVPGLEDTPSAANAELIATPSTGENIRISTNEEGRFSTELPADSYLLMADGQRLYQRPICA